MNSILFSANDLKMHPSFSDDGYAFFSECLRPEIFASLGGMRGDCAELRAVLLNKESVSRKLLPAHLTTSSVVLSPDGQQCLLLLHRKIGEWVYPGGHADGDWNLLRSALRECFEETALEQVEVLPPTWVNRAQQSFYFPHFFVRFVIKSTPKVVEHLHFDCVYVFRAKDNRVRFDSNESRDAAWFDLDLLREHALRDDGQVSDGLDALTARLCLSAVQSALGGHPPKGACVDLD